MPRKNRTASSAPVDRSTLYSTESLSGAELEILHDAELMIRRRKLRLQILSNEDAASWAWNAFIESLGSVKAMIEIGLAPSARELSESQIRAVGSIVSAYQKAHGSSPIDYSTVLNEIDTLCVNGISTRELLLRLQGDNAKPRARYAESWEVENSGLFDVKRAAARESSQEPAHAS